MCPQLCWLIHKTAGQYVFLEYRRHANDSWSGSARNRMFAIFLLPVCYLFATCLLSVCYLFATCLLPLPSAVKRVRKESGTLAMYTSPRRKGSPSESRSSLRADHPRLNPTPLAINPAMPDGLANASRPHSKLRTRSPLSGWFMMAFRALAGF